MRALVRGALKIQALTGLFRGAIVLSVGYNLLVQWIGEGQN